MGFDGDFNERGRKMRKVRVKKLRKELKAILGDKPMTAWMWRKHKEAYVRG
jgi:hypothetical protein